MAKYFAILTEAGEAKMARALVSNTMVPLTEMAVGDGGIDGGTDGSSVAHNAASDGSPMKT